MTEEELKIELETEYGRIYETEELMVEYEITSFMAPFVAVVRKSDNQKGTMRFTHMPRFYYDFIPSESEQ